MGPVSKKLHQNFYKNFCRTFLKTWTNPIYTCIKSIISKDPIAKTKATGVPTTVLNKKIQENKKNRSSSNQLQGGIDLSYF